MTWNWQTHPLQASAVQFGPKLPPIKEMSPALFAAYRKPIQDASRARRQARQGLEVDPLKRKKARRKGVNAKRALKSCSLVEGVEFLALDPCAYCGNPVATTHDHVEPISRGGAHHVENLVRACWSCNKAKNVQSLLLFLVKRARRRAA